MKSIEDHIQHDKELIADPKTSEPMKRHALDELHELTKKYKIPPSGFIQKDIIQN